MNDFHIELPALGAGDIPHMDQYFGPWAIAPDYLRPVFQAVGQVDMQAHLQLANRPMADPQHTLPDAEGISLIQIVGTMTKYGSSFSTGGSTIRARQAIRDANRDPDTKAILLRLESPGGSVAGTAELADAVRESTKPVVAFIDDLGASAAYYVASQAKTIIANKAAMIGSIGTFTSVVDMSKAAEKAGIKVHLITTGPHKGAGTPGTAISDQHLATWQETVEKMNTMFLTAVKTGRRMSDGQVKAIATGQMWLADDALQLGLIDRVASYEDAYAAALQMRQLGPEVPLARRQVSLLQAIQSRCPDASAEFLVEAVKSDMSPEAAATAWQKQIEARHQAELEAARQRAAELANELAELRCKQAVPPGNDPLLGYHTGNGHAYATCPDPLAEFNHRIDEMMRERKCDRATAARLVNRQCPGLTDAIRQQFDRQ